MRETIHIFLKDLRGLQAEIYIFVSVVALTLLIYRPDQDLVQLLPFLAAGYLIARVIHAEPLVGTTQFWVTRPYRRKSLFSAKILFLVVCVHLPLAMAQAIFLWKDGFPLVGNQWGLLWSQILLFICFSFPIAAVASMTRRLGTFIIFLIVVPALAAGVANFSNRWNPFGISMGRQEWVRDSVLAVALFLSAAVVLLLQYRKRVLPLSVGLGIAVMAVGFLAWLRMPFPVAWEIEAAASPRELEVLPNPVVTMGDVDRFSVEGIFLAGNQRYTVVEFPVVADVQLPDGVSMAVPKVIVWLEGDGGQRVSLNSSVSVIDFRSSIRVGKVRSFIRWSDYQRIRRSSVTIHATFYFVYSRKTEAVVPLNTSAVYLSPNVQCFVEKESRKDETFFSCRYAFREPPYSIVVDGFPLVSQRTYSPYPSDLLLYPIIGDGKRWEVERGLQEVPLIVETPMAYARQDYEFRNISLEDNRGKLR